jgi:hypothetical protein
VYEVVEWLVAAIVDPAAGTAFLGTQGDEWDAQKDMALALAGGLAGAALEWLGERRGDAPEEVPMHRRDETETHEPDTSWPTRETLMRWLDDQGCEATDGCWVPAERDACAHDKPTWAYVLGHSIEDDPR